MLPSSRRVSIRPGAAASIRLTAIRRSNSIADVLRPISTSGSSLSSRPSGPRTRTPTQQLEQRSSPRRSCVSSISTTTLAVLSSLSM